MKTYELTYLISSELTEEEAEKIQKNINTLIQEEEGILLEEKLPFRKKLAYSVKKQSQAFLATIIFQLLPEKLASLEKKIKVESQILRYLILVKKITKEAKSPRFFKRPQVLRVEKEKKVDLKEVEKKLEEILNESE